MKFRRNNLLRSVALLLICLLISGCSVKSHTPDDLSEVSNIWVVTEASVSDGMNHQLQLAMDQFTSLYPDLTFNLDILPIDENERSAYIDFLYAQIKAGQGPDVYLLPTSDVLVLEEPQPYTYRRIQPLFPDVNAAMHNGYFLDFNTWFQDDPAIDFSRLNLPVMDAGLIGQKRYALPLRYDCPVLYEYDNYMSRNQIDETILCNGIDAWMQYAVSSNDPVIACSAEYITIQAFSNVVDYSDGSITLTHDSVRNYLKLLQKVQALIGDEYEHRTSASLIGYLHNIWTQFPLQINTLSNASFYAAIAKANGQSLKMHPVRTTDGDYTATIKYYAAIGANTKLPQVAYEFIRQFLSEDFQLEKNRLKPESKQYNGLIETSWPVLYRDSTSTLWENLQQQVNSDYGLLDAARERQNSILEITLSDSDIPILNQEIDFGRFPVYFYPNMYTYAEQLNDVTQNNTPSDVDINALSDTLLHNLSDFYQQIYN